MENLPVHITNELRNILFEAVVPSGTSEKARFEVIIKMKDKDVSVRQLAAYLNYIDKSYGRFTPEGLLSYSRSQEHELKITEFRRGTLEIVLSNYLANPGSIIALILVAFSLKYLPGIIKSTLSAYRDYEEGKLAKMRRQQIKEQMRKDEYLEKLNNRQLLQLSKLFDAMYGLDIRDVPKAHKLSVETVIEIQFRVNSPDETPLGQNRVRKLRLRRNLQF